MMKERLFLQKTNSDCGLASVTMVCEASYDDVLKAFMDLGLYAKHSKIRPYATNFKDVKAMLSNLGFEGKVKKFKSWEDITSPAIIKVSGMSKRNFHWMVAIPCDEHKLVIYNPSYELVTYYKNPPLDEMYVAIDWYTPIGSYISVEKSI
jgi:ABC-type bacteriocin/lantibiotic exporter with double-glycine peptidase domain